MRTMMITIGLLLAMSSGCDEAGGGGDRASARSSGSSNGLTYGEEYAACDADYLAWFPEVPDDAVINGYTCHPGSLEGDTVDICPDAVVLRIPGDGAAVECGSASSAGITWIAPS